MAPITPSVLRWARESIAVDDSELAKYLDVDKSLVRSWESGAESPSYSTVEKIAAYLRRPTATFFLPRPPRTHAPPPDFRIASIRTKRPLSRSTLLAIRRARWLRDVHAEISQSRAEAPQLRPRAASDPESTALRARESLGITSEEQLSWRDTYAAFRSWRDAFERQGLLVFQFRMPSAEVSAFSLIEPPGPPVIVVNPSDVITRRIFSLFHEYGHVLRRHSGVCSPIESDQKARLPIERFADQFAAAFLVPRDVLQASWSRLSRPDADDTTLRRIQHLATRFKVSREVLLRRILTIDQIDEAEYRKLSRELHRSYPRTYKPGGARGETRVVRSLRERGPRFVASVLSAVEQRLISRGEASYALGIAANELPMIANTLER